MLYSAEMESNSLYYAQVMSDNKDLKTEKKGILGILYEKRWEKMTGREREGKFTKIIYTFNPKLIVLGIKTDAIECI